MRPFSVVIPIRDDVDLIRQNLPSWCELNPDEILLCFDFPAPTASVQEAAKIAAKHHVNLRILEVSRNAAYNFHQAWVRRSGFRAARNDVILTGDIDLLVYPSCLKAINLVGTGHIGLVSLSKKRRRRGTARLRNVMDALARRYALVLGSAKAGQAYFTGLYGLYRPMWLDSEPEDVIKMLYDPKSETAILDSWGGYRGEDTFLRDCMLNKHEVRYLPDVGALDCCPSLEDTKPIQMRIGACFAAECRSPLFVFRHSLIHLRPYVLGSYLHTMSRAVGTTRSLVYLICNMLVYLVYVGLYCALRMMLGRPKRDKLFLRDSGERKITWWARPKSLMKMVQRCGYEFPVSITAKGIKGDLFVDIGADKGYYSLLLRENFKRILAFEPSDTSETLRENLRRAQVWNAEVVKKAVYDCDNPVSMYRAQYEKHGNVCIPDTPIVPHPSYAQFIAGEHSFIGKTTVECVTLASYFAHEAKIDLIKLDAEGGEWHVLRGAEPIIGRIQRWIIELHQPWRRREMEKWMDDHAYNYRWLDMAKLTGHIYAWRSLPHG